MSEEGVYRTVAAANVGLDGGGAPSAPVQAPPPAWLALPPLPAFFAGGAREQQPPPPADASRSEFLLGGGLTSGLSLAPQQQQQQRAAAWSAPSRRRLALLGLALLGAACVAALGALLLGRQAAAPGGAAPSAASGSPSPPVPPSPSPWPLASPSATETPLPAPQAQNVSEADACVLAAGAFLNASLWNLNYSSGGYVCRGSGAFPPTQDAPHRGTVLPLPHGLIAASMAAVCSPSAATQARAMLSGNLTELDMCVFVAFLSSISPAPAALSTWATLIPASNLWLHPMDSSAYPGGGVDSQEALAALAAAAALPQAAATCKWWLYVENGSVWVNPRVVRSAAVGVTYNASRLPIVMANFWYGMGFTGQSTMPNPGTALFSAAAARALGRVLRNATGGCLAEQQSKCGPTSVTCALAGLWLCLLTEGGILPVHLQNTDPSGALVFNGLPFEPGPPYPPDAYKAAMLQPLHLAAHWAWVGGVTDALVNRLWAAYQEVYGAWAQPEAAAAAAAAATRVRAAGAEGCAAQATHALQALVNATRTSPTSATPLSLEVAGSAIGAACAWLLRLPVARATLFALAQGDASDGGALAAQLFAQGWGWEYGANVLVFGAAPPAGSRMRALEALRGVPASRAGALVLLAADAVLAREGRLLSDFPWVFLGADGTAANPEALAGITAQLHPDVPLALAFYSAAAAPAPPTTRPLQGMLLLSRAAVARVLPLLGSAACPLDGASGDATDDGGALGRCLWLAGAVPVHTFALDPFGFVPGLIDWAYAPINVQNGFAASAFTQISSVFRANVFRVRHEFLQVQYCGCANLSSACNASSAPAPEAPEAL